MKIFEKLRKSWNKNNLDEMQEQKLLHIERDAFWLLYFLIVLDLIVKCVLGKSRWEVLSEALCFIIVSIVMVSRCIKNGIWDRKIGADSRSNMVLSAIAGIIVAVVNIPVYYWNAGNQFTPGLLAAMLISGIFTFILAFFFISVCAGLYKRKKNQLEEEEDEDD